MMKEKIIQTLPYGFEKKRKTIQCNTTFQMNRAKQTKHDLLLSKAVSGFVHVFFGCAWTCLSVHRCVDKVCLFVSGYKWMGLIRLPFFFLRWLFFSIKNECLPFCSLSLFPASAPTPSLFHYYPLYILSIFFKLSLYITLRMHARTHACTHTQCHFLPSLLLVALSSHLILWDPLSLSLSLSEHISSKALHTGNTHPDLINCC